MMNKKNNMIFDENKGLIKEDGDLEWTPIFGNNINEVVDNLLPTALAVVNKNI